MQSPHVDAVRPTRAVWPTARPRPRSDRPSSQQQCDQLNTAPATRPPEGRTLQECVPDVRARPRIQQHGRQRQCGVSRSALRRYPTEAASIHEGGFVPSVFEQALMVMAMRRPSTVQSVSSDPPYTQPGSLPSDRPASEVTSAGFNVVTDRWLGSVRQLPAF